ncbi:MAG TPA: hypothetical protein VL137_11650 [Polyangiaceae bacterium]|nr:hypothetical protein [Polyangiaceae bacterium]
MFSGLLRAGGEIWDRSLDFYERSKLLLGGCTVVLLVGLGLSQGGQRIESMVIGFGLPAFAAFSAAKARHAGQAGNALVAVTVLATLIGCETVLAHTLFEPAPLGATTLSSAEPKGTIDTSEEQFAVETFGDLSNTSSADAQYSYDLSRGQSRVTISGELTRTANKSRQRSRLVPVLGHTYDTERELITVPGTGPVEATLSDLSGNAIKTLQVRLLPAPMGGRVWLWLLIASAALALLIDTVSSERRSLGHASWVAASSAFSVNLMRHYSPHDPMGATVGSLFFAVGAAFAAWVLTFILYRISGGARRAA